MDGRPFAPNQLETGKGLHAQVPQILFNSLGGAERISCLPMCPWQAVGLRVESFRQPAVGKNCTVSHSGWPRPQPCNTVVNAVVSSTAGSKRRLDSPMFKASVAHYVQAKAQRPSAAPSFTQPWACGAQCLQRMEPGRSLLAGKARWPCAWRSLFVKAFSSCIINHQNG